MNLPTYVDDPSEILINVPITMPELDGLAGSIHLFDKDSIDALSAAYTTGRPLLISGEPGVGKSQLARAAAAAMGRALITYMVEPRTEPQDLRYRFDAIGRLADAQANTQQLVSKVPGRTALDPIHYIEPGPLWWALNWKSADGQLANLRGRYHKPHDQDNTRGVVLLIDEIDKADSDIPNSLLDALGNRRFHVPWLDSEIALAKDAPPPLIIITTNKERELPIAFVRRCVVLAIELPIDLEPWLVNCAREHLNCWRLGDQSIPECSDTFLLNAAKLLSSHRMDAEKLGMRPPATAEYLDLVCAVLRHKKYSEASASDLLERMARYTLAKAKSQP